MEFPGRLDCWLIQVIIFVYMENQLSKLLLIVQHAVPEPIQGNTVI